MSMTNEQLQYLFATGLRRLERLAEKIESLETRFGQHDMALTALRGEIKQALVELTKQATAAELKLQAVLLAVDAGAEQASAVEVGKPTIEN